MYCVVSIVVVLRIFEAVNLKCAKVRLPPLGCFVLQLKLILYSGL